MHTRTHIDTHTYIMKHSATDQLLEQEYTISEMCKIKIDNLSQHIVLVSDSNRFSIKDHHQV